MQSFAATTLCVTATRICLQLILGQSLQYLEAALWSDEVRGLFSRLSVLSGTIFLLSFFFFIICRNWYSYVVSQPYDIAPTSWTQKPLQCFVIKTVCLNSDTSGKWSSCNFNDFSRFWSSWWRVQDKCKDSRQRNLCRFTCLCSRGRVWIACLQIEEQSCNNWLHRSLSDEEHCHFSWLYHSCQSMRLRTCGKTFVRFSTFWFWN